MSKYPCSHLVILTAVLLVTLAITGCCSYTSNPAEAGGPGSRTNPAPPGTAVTYKPSWQSAGFEKSTINITLLEVAKGEEAATLMKSDKDIIYPRNKSEEVLLAKFRVEIVEGPSDHTFRVNFLDFNAAYRDGTVIDETTYCSYSDSLMVELFKGGREEGWIVLQYDKLESSPLVVFDPRGGGAWFRTG